MSSNIKTTYLKNSTTNVVMKMKTYIGKIKNVPTNFSDVNNYFIGSDLCIDGFIEISEKSFKLEHRKQRKNK